MWSVSLFELPVVRKHGHSSIPKLASGTVPVRLLQGAASCEESESNPCSPELMALFAFLHGKCVWGRKGHG